MACEPAVNDVVRLAVPAASSATTPNTVDPSLKVMLPVGMPELPVGVTWAVNVTACPAAAGLRLDASDVLVAAGVGAGFTVCDSAGEVLGADPESPPYSAVSECVPAARADVVKAARPDASRAEVPSTVAPSRNVTVPVGAAPEED